MPQCRRPFPTLAEPIDNSPAISLQECLAHGGNVEQPYGSPIRACCIDGPGSDITGIKGCYICERDWTNCVWDPARTASSFHNNVAPNSGLNVQTPLPNPKPGVPHPTTGGVRAP